VEVVDVELEDAVVVVVVLDDDDVVELVEAVLEVEAVELVELVVDAVDDVDEVDAVEDVDEVVDAVLLVELVVLVVLDEDEVVAAAPNMPVLILSISDRVSISSKTTTSSIRPSKNREADAAVPRAPIRTSASSTLILLSVFPVDSVTLDPLSSQTRIRYDLSLS
jgi:hypothetical protein